MLSEDRKYLLELAISEKWASAIVDCLRDVCRCWQEWDNGSHTTVWKTQQTTFVDNTVIVSGDMEDSESQVC